jgi:hypothetical protein
MRMAYQSGSAAVMHTEGRSSTWVLTLGTVVEDLAEARVVRAALSAPAG